MKAAILFRIAAVVFLLFAAGHTFGFLSYVAPTPEARAVFDAMNKVHFTDGGKEFSYGNWYRGFGISATVSLIFQAFLAWHLGRMARRGAGDVKTLGWALFAWQLPGVALAWMYFGIPPMVLSAIVTVLIGAAAWLANRPVNR